MEYDGGMDLDNMKEKYLTFKLDQEVYGIEIQYVTEIIGMQKITEVPDNPGFISGIINLRGKIIPLMDVRIRFKKSQKEFNDRTCIIVIDIYDMSIGLIVDKVLEVITIPGQELQSVPDCKAGFKNTFLSSIGKVGESVVLILDCDKLIQKEDKCISIHAEEGIQ